MTIDQNDPSGDMAKLRLSRQGQRLQSKIATTSSSFLALPRKVRDRVYRHLLDHNLVRAPPYGQRFKAQNQNGTKASARTESHAHTYKFHIAILLVNHQVRGEALKILEDNDFVVVSCRIPGIGFEIHNSSIPIVCQAREPRIGERYFDVVRNFKQHVMKIYIDPRQDVGRRGDAPAFIMVADDLPVLRDMIQLKFYRMHSPAPTVAFLADGKLGNGRVIHKSGLCGAQEFVETHLRFSPKCLASTDTDRARNLLAPFREMIHGGQRVKFFDFPPGLKDEVETLKTSMGPKTIFITAFAWHSVATVSSVMERGYAHSDAGNVELAVDCFNQIVENVRWPFELSHDMRVSDVAVPSTMIFCKYMDALVMVAAFAMERAGRNKHKFFPELDYLKALTTNTSTILQQWAASSCIPAMQVSAARLKWITTMLGFFLDYNMSVTASRAVRLLKEVEEPLRSCTHFDRDLALVMSLVYDSQLRQDYLTPSGNFSYWIWAETSFAKFGWQVFKTLMPADYVKPNGTSGYFDSDEYDKIQAVNPELAATFQ